MCGIEILLCCAAGTAVGCCGRHKLGKKGGKSDGKGGKDRADEHETYRRNGAPAGKPAKRGKASPEKQRLQPRLTAYEEYQLREQAAEKKRKPQPPQPLQAAPASAGNLMDADEFSRLQAHRHQKKQAGWRLAGSLSY